MNIDIVILERQAPRLCIVLLGFKITLRVIICYSTTRPGIYRARWWHRWMWMYSVGNFLFISYPVFPVFSVSYNKGKS